MDWVCNDAWRGPFTQSMAFLGAVVGALVFGSMADYFGRYPTFVLTNAILFISGVVTPFCTDFYRVVQLDFTLEIEVFYLLLDRSLSIFSMKSLQQHIQYFSSFWSNVQLDPPIASSWRGSSWARPSTPSTPSFMSSVRLNV